MNIIERLNSQEQNLNSCLRSDEVKNHRYLVLHMLRENFKAQLYILCHNRVKRKHLLKNWREIISFFGPAYVEILLQELRRLSIYYFVIKE